MGADMLSAFENQPDGGYEDEQSRDETCGQTQERTFEAHDRSIDQLFIISIVVHGSAPRFTALSESAIPPLNSFIQQTAGLFEFGFSLDQ